MNSHEMTDGTRRVAIGRPKHREGYSIAICENGYHTTAVPLDEQMLGWLHELIGDVLQKGEPGPSPDYMATMGKIAQVARQITGGRDINRFDIPGANLWDVGPLVAELQRLLDEYDRQMIEASRHES